MRSRYFYTIGITFASGIFTRSFFDVGIEEALFLLLLSFVLAYVWRRSAEDFSSLLFIMSLALLCFTLGALRLDVTDRAISAFSAYENTEVALEGIVVREPDERESTVHLYVRVDELDELVLVTTDVFQSFAYGDRVLVEGELAQPESFETELGRTFNYPGYLKARGVSYVVPFADVAVLDQGEGDAFLSALFTGKAAFMRSVENILPEPEAGLGEGVLLGVKRALGDDLEQTFRQTGIIHIVVLSGYNVMLVAEAIMRLLSFFFLPRTRMIVGIVGISSFALLVGLSATVVRASLMAVLLLVARATGRTYAIVRALVLAGLVMLLINPYLLAFDPGFQLSFAATLGLILLGPLIEKKLSLVPTAFQFREFLTATIATQIFILPLLLYLIGQFSLVSVIVNVLVLPMVPVAMILTFVAGSVGLLMPALGILAGYTAHLSLSYIIAVAEFFGGLPFAAIGVPLFPFWLVIVAYGAIGYGLFLLSRETVEEDVKEEPDEDSDITGLSGWIIEEEIEDSPEALRTSEESVNTFPFR